MKKTANTVRMIGNTRRTVSGYTFTTGALRIGITNRDPRTGETLPDWTITELRTGFRIGEAHTLKAAQLEACRIARRISEALAVFAADEPDYNPGIVPEYTILAA